jgi:hypothetical protein
LTVQEAWKSASLWPLGGDQFLDGLRDEDVAAVYRFDSKVERIQDFSGGRDWRRLVMQCGPRA